MAHERHFTRLICTNFLPVLIVTDNGCGGTVTICTVVSGVVSGVDGGGDGKNSLESMGSDTGMGEKTGSSSSITVSSSAAAGSSSVATATDTMATVTDVLASDSFLGCTMTAAVAGALVAGVLVAASVQTATDFFFIFIAGYPAAKSVVVGAGVGVPLAPAASIVPERLNTSNGGRAYQFVRYVRIRER